MVCAHVIPLQGLFLPMPTYEQHYYYDLLFLALLVARPDVKIIYLDLACRYIGRFKRLVAEQVERGNLSAMVSKVNGSLQSLLLAHRNTSILQSQSCVLLPAQLLALLPFLFTVLCSTHSPVHCLICCRCY